MAKRRKKSAGGLPAKGRLRDIADKLWSIAVRADWLHRCAICRVRKCEAHHLIPRQNYFYRYNLENGVCLCSTHHQFCPDRSPHQNAAGFMLWLSMHEPIRHRWLIAAVESKQQFTGTKNAAYFCDVIRSLRQYVEPEDFERIVGVRLAAQLDEEEDME